MVCLLLSTMRSSGKAKAESDCGQWRAGCGGQRGSVGADRLSPLWSPARWRKLWTGSRIQSQGNQALKVKPLPRQVCCAKVMPFRTGTRPQPASLLGADGIRPGEENLPREPGSRALNAESPPSRGGQDRHG